jgi:outer membrane protein OmpA-like peptidoglycan-associated protein/Tol biopolymer transport system component
MNSIKKIVSIVVCLLAICGGYSLAQKSDKKYSSSSDKAIKWYEKAMQSFDMRKDNEAVECLKKAIGADANFIEAHMFLAEVYAENKQYKEALSEGKIAVSISPDFFKSAYYSMGFWCLKLQEYDEAEKNFTHYLTYKSIPAEASSNAKLGLKSARFAKQAVKNPVPFNPINMGVEVNSTENDYLPAITADEQNLIYTRLIPKPGQVSGPGNKGKSEDFYACKKMDGKWSKAVNIGPPINTSGNEGAQCISADGQTLIFTACSEYDGYPGGRNGFGSCDLFIAKKLANGKWSNPENLGKNINSDSWESQPSLSSDGQTLYFVSNRPGGKGSADIWKSVKNEAGKWSPPMNLGDSINTPGFEESPFIHPDNKTLYFVSDQWPGMGSRDIFLTRINKDGSFSTPMNLGYPINTGENERDLIVSANARTAYFSSEREGGFGGLDLYSFDLYQAARPYEVTYVKGRVYNKENNNGIDAKFELVDLETGQLVMQASSMPGSGEFLVCLPVNKNYLMNVSKNGFLFASENFSLKGISSNLKGYEMNMPLTPIKAGEKVVLKNIFFETGSYQLKNESKIELQKLKSFLQLNTTVSIEISGHTDNVGDKKSNQILSQNRAKAVYDYLIANEITKERLSYKGFGDSMPIDDNNTDKGRANNRRTEFMILK